MLLHGHGRWNTPQCAKPGISQRGFSPERLRKIELLLITNTARSGGEQERLLLNLAREHFPHLTEEELRKAIEP